MKKGKKEEPDEAEKKEDLGWPKKKEKKENDSNQ